MATVPAAVKPSPSAKYDAQVAAQLAKAQRRVRALDLAAGILGFLALSLGFALVMVLLHWKLDLGNGARQIALVVYLWGAAAYLTWRVFLPLRRPINPRFAALQLERTLPGAKNSVVNYVDLRHEELPAAIRGAIGRRAAKDAVQADIERAIPGKNVGLAGGLAAVAAVLCLALMFSVGFRDFFRLLGNVIAPITPAAAPPAGPKNRVVVRQPDGGDAVVAAGSALAFAVRVEGELAPGETPKLNITYPQAKDTLVRNMVKPKSPGGDWTADVSAAEIRDGFTYTATAGDAESPVYRVSIFFTPAITKFQAVYHYPTYIGEPLLRVQMENRRLQAWRGSAVDVRVQTNGGVKEAQVELMDQNGVRKSFDAPIAADDPDAFTTRIESEDFDKFSHYRLRFTSSRGETYVDPLMYEIIADLDKPPHKVEITKPAAEKLPANGLLKLEGRAEDDIGVKGMSVCLKIVEPEANLKAKPYRCERDLRLPSGGFLKSLEYKDAVDLKTVQSADGKPIALKAGMTLEYWLEAYDACPRAKPEFGESKHFRVTLTAPEQNPQQQQQERNDARKEQQQHQAKQDDELRKEDQQRRDEQEKAEKQEKENRGKEGEKNAPDKTQNENPQPGDKLDGDKQDEFNKAQKQQEESDRRNQENQQGNAEPREQPGEKSDKQDPKGEAKENKSNAGESKPAENKQGESKGKPQPSNKGEGKPEPKEGEKKEAGQCKECKNPGGQGAGKEGGKEAMNGEKGDGKGGGGSGNEPMGQKPGEAKNDEPGQSKAEKSGEGKSGDPKGGGGQAAQGKVGGADQKHGKPQGKDAGSGGQVADGKPAGDAKDKPPEKSATPGGATAKESGGPQGMGTQEPGSATGNGGGGANAKAENKTGPNQTAQGTATPKPDEPKRTDGGADVSKVDAKRPSEKDLENIEKALKSGDDQQARDALEKLKEVAKKAEDPNVREAADDLQRRLKEFADSLRKKEEDAGQEKTAKAPRPNGPPEQQPAEKKDGPGNGEKQSADAKEAKGDPMQKNAAEKGPGRKEQAGNPMMPPDGSKDSDSTKATVKGPANPVGRNSPQSDDEHHAQGPRQPANPLKQPNSTLQLKKFNPDDYRNTLEDKILAQRKPQPPEPKPASVGNPEKLPEPNRPSALPSIAGAKRDPNAPAAEAIDAGRGQPPPGYRKTVPEFTKERAQPEK